MDRLKKTIICLCVLLGIGVLPAQAVVIVDTGVPSMISGISLTETQFLAGRMTFSDAQRITGIAGWIDQYYQDARSLTLAVYGDGGVKPGYDADGYIPDASNLIFSDTFFVPGCPGGACADWYGLSGMSLNLDPGSYWVSFEVLPGNTYNGAMSVIPPDPLYYAVFYDAGRGYKEWWPHYQNGFGLRVYSEGEESHAVPEPATVLLLGAGLTGFVLRRRRA